MLFAALRHQPSRRVRTADRPEREHHLLLPDRCHERRGHQLRVRTDRSDPPATTAPTIVTDEASSITNTSATLNASVNPEGSEVSEEDCTTSNTAHRPPTGRRSMLYFAARYRHQPSRRVRTADRPEREHHLLLPDRCHERRGTQLRIRTDHSDPPGDDRTDRCHRRRSFFDHEHFRHPQRIRQP